jgi:hypothetical protein
MMAKTITSIVIRFFEENRSKKSQLSIEHINMVIDVAAKQEGNKKMLLPGLVLVKLGKYIRKG